MINVAFVHSCTLVPPLSLWSQTTRYVSWRGAHNHPYLNTADPTEEEKRHFCGEKKQRKYTDIAHELVNLIFHTRPCLQKN